MSQFATLKLTLPIDEQETRRVAAIRVQRDIIIHPEPAILREIQRMAKLDGMTPEAYLLRLHLRYVSELREAML